VIGGLGVGGALANFVLDYIIMIGYLMRYSFEYFIDSPNSSNKSRDRRLRIPKFLTRKPMSIYEQEPG